MSFIYRDIFTALKAHLSKKQITVITGMRRTGKTTLVKQLMAESGLKHQVYLDLERIDNRILFSELNYENIVLALKQRGLDFSGRILIGLDEIQLVPNLPSVVKYLYDNYDIKFILTGSSSYYLKNAFQESLAGRKRIFEVFPLGFKECLRFQGVSYTESGIAPWETPFLKSEYERLYAYYEAFIKFGGFPEVVLAEDDLTKSEIIGDIVSSYINIDIGALSDIKRLTDVHKLMKLLVARAGSKIEISKLCQVLALTRASVENYLDLMEYSYLIKTIPVTSRNPEREIVKARKLYFLDNGIMNHLGMASSGSQFENCVFTQIKVHGEISYFQLKTGEEIDFVLDGKAGFEVKETPQLSDFQQLNRLAKLIGTEPNKVVFKHAYSKMDSNCVWGGFLG